MLELLGQMKPFRDGGQMVFPFQFLIAISTIGHHRQIQTTVLLLEHMMCIGGGGGGQYIGNLGLHISNLSGWRIALIGIRDLEDSRWILDPRRAF